MSEDKCSWCGVAVEPDDGYRLAEPAGVRRAVFCRLEHVVPWAMRAPSWETGELEAPGDAGEECAHCGEPLGETRVVLVRHRGEHRIPDAFCSVEHAADWANAGGRWRT